MFIVIVGTISLNDMGRHIVYLLNMTTQTDASDIRNALETEEALWQQNGEQQYQLMREDFWDQAAPPSYDESSPS